jgi:threonine aldolase
VTGLGVTAADFARACLVHDVRVRAIGGSQIRATTHLDVSRAEVERAAQVIRAEAARFFEQGSAAR